MKRLIALAFAMMATPAHANDIWVDGNALYAKCKSKQSAEQVACGYYILGVIDSTVMDKERGITTPQGVKLTQIVDMVVQSMEKNPDKRHYPAAIIVRAVIDSAWPKGGK